MRRLLLALLLVAGCKKADGLLVLTVDASPALAELTLLHITATAGGRSVSFDDHPAASFSLPPARTLGIDFPAAVAGPMMLHVEAHNAVGIVASGDVAISTVAGGRADVTLTLGASSGVGDDGGVGDGGGPDMPTVVGCVNGDGVCGSGCNQTNDNDCPALCGNGVLESGEVCDDGNVTNGDGCDPTCQFTNTLSIVMGTANGQGRADGIGPAARLRGPTGITTDQVNVYFGDDCAVKMYDPKTKLVTTLAGAWGDCQQLDGLGTASRLEQVSDLEFVPNTQKGVLYIGGNTLLRKLDLATLQLSSVTGVAGKDSSGFTDGVGSSSDGTTLYLVDFVNGLRAINLATNGTTLLASSAQMNNARCSDVGRFGADLYLACSNMILKVTPNGTTPTVTTYAGNSSSGPCLTSTGNDLTTARFKSLNRMVIDNLGSITATDDGCHTVWNIYPGAIGSVSVVAGSLNVAGHADSPVNMDATHGTMSAPTGVAIANGYSYVAETSGASDAYGRTLRGFSQGTQLLTLAGVPSNGVGTTSTGSSPTFESPYLVLANGNNPLVANFSFGGVSETFKLDLAANSDSVFNTNLLSGVIVGSNLFGASSNNDNTLSTYPLNGGAEAHYAGMAHSAAATAMDGTFVTAVMNRPSPSTSDGTNLYFLDGKLVRMVDVAHQLITTLAGADATTDVKDDVGKLAHFANPGELVFAGGSLYLTDGTSAQGQVVRQIDLATRKVTTIAGTDGMPGEVDGVGSAARFSGAVFMTSDGKALYLSEPGGGAKSNAGNGGPGDSIGPVIRELELATRRVTTMVGARGQWSARPGVGAKAALNQPEGISFDTATHALYVVDAAENVVYRIK